MYQHLIWLTDLSENAALCRAPLLALARGLGAEVSVVYALGGLAQLEEEITPGVWAEVATLVEAGVTAHPVISHSQPEQLAASWDRGDELILIGRTGVSGLDRVLLGSTTRKVLDEAHADVLVVGGKPFEGLRSVLCPVDLSPGAPSPVGAAAALGLAMRAPVTFLHVQPHADATPPQEHLVALQARVAEALSAEQLDALEDRYEVGRGETPEQALMLVAEQHDLVVMASRERGPLARLLLGSVTDHLARHAPVPVLVARER